MNAIAIVFAAVCVGEAFIIWFLLDSMNRIMDEAKPLNPINWEEWNNDR